MGTSPRDLRTVPADSDLPSSSVDEQARPAPENGRVLDRIAVMPSASALARILLKNAKCMCRKMPVLDPHPPPP